MTPRPTLTCEAAARGTCCGAGAAPARNARPPTMQRAPLTPGLRWPHRRPLPSFGLFQGGSRGILQPNFTTTIKGADFRWVVEVGARAGSARTPDLALPPPPATPRAPPPFSLPQRDLLRPAPPGGQEGPQGRLWRGEGLRGWAWSGRAGQGRHGRAGAAPQRRLLRVLPPARWGAGAPRAACPCHRPRSPYPAPRAHASRWPQAPTSASTPTPLARLRTSA